MSSTKIDLEETQKYFRMGDQPFEIIVKDHPMNMTITVWVKFELEDWNLYGNWQELPKESGLPTIENTAWRIYANVLRNIADKKEDFLLK